METNVRVGMFTSFLSRRYINLEVRAGTLSLYATLMFYVKLYNHAILEVIQPTCNLVPLPPPSKVPPTLQFYKLYPSARPN